MLFSSACSDSDEYFGAPAIKQPAPKEVYIEGTVKTDTGTPLADVVVSDGYNLTTTDVNGKYIMKSEVALGYIYVSTPDGYEPAAFLDNNRPKPLRRQAECRCRSLQSLRYILPWVPVA